MIEIQWYSRIPHCQNQRLEFSGFSRILVNIHIIVAGNKIIYIAFPGLLLKSFFLLKKEPSLQKKCIWI